MVRVIGILSALLVLSPTLSAAQQALADVAKVEEARRKTVNQPSRVYTNGDLRSDFTSSAAVPAPAPSASAPVAAPAVPASSSSSDPAASAKAPVAAAQTAAPGGRDEAYWKRRMSDAKDSLNRSRMFLDALQSRINALTTQVINRDDPYQQAALEQDRQKNLAELERVKQDIVNHTKAVAAIEEEARKAGAPPGWLR